MKQTKKNVYQKSKGGCSLKCNVQCDNHVLIMADFSETQTSNFTKHSVHSLNLRTH